MTIEGAGRIDNIGIFRLRAMEMLNLKVQGYTNAKIGERFGVGVDTVRRSLEYAGREGLVKEYENQLIAELIPEAIRVYKEKLTDENDPYVAKDIIDKLIKLGDRFQIAEAKQEELTLSAYLEGKQKRKDQLDESKNSDKKGSKEKYVGSASIVNNSGAIEAGKTPDGENVGESGV